MSNSNSSPSDSPNAENRRSATVNVAVTTIINFIGYPPTRTLVVLWYDHTDPEPHAYTLHSLPVTADRLTEVLTALAQSGQHQGAHSATAVIIDDSAAAGDTHAPLIDAFVSHCRALRITVLAAVWLPAIELGAKWRSYLDSTVAGRLPHATSSMSRTENHISPALADGKRDGSAINTAEAWDFPTSYVTARRAIQHSTQCRLVRDTINAIGHPDRDGRLDQHQISTLISALSDTHVRACCTVGTLRDNPRAEQLWLFLTNAVGGKERATPALLLAISAHLRGSAPLARMAINMALRAQPYDTLTRVIDAHIYDIESPAELRATLETAAAIAPQCPEWTHSVSTEHEGS